MQSATTTRKIKDFRDWLLYIFLLGVMQAFRLLSRRMAIVIMRGLARLLFFSARGMRAHTIRHLIMAFGEEKNEAEIKEMAFQVFRHFCTILADILRMDILIRQGLDKLVTAEGMEHARKAMADGRGAILLTGHFGNWEILGAWTAQNGIPLKVVGKPLFNPQIDRLLVNIRNQAGYTNIARGKATREIIRTFKKGDAVGFLIDQDTKVPGVFVSFFGQPTHTPVGAAQLAQKFGVDIIPIFMYLRDDLTYHIECSPPITFETTGDPEEDLFLATQKCSDAYERIIRRFPTQWVWMHKRWKKQPERYGPDAIGSKKIFG